jgi:hypothetical protein
MSSGLACCILMMLKYFPIRRTIIGKLNSHHIKRAHDGASLGTAVTITTERTTEPQ